MARSGKLVGNRLHMLRERSTRMSSPFRPTLNHDRSFGVLVALLVAALGASLSVLVAYQSVLILGLVLASSLAVIAFKRPVLCLKILLLMGGIPLVGLGQSKVDPAQKPLLRALGGTSVDGLCLVALCFALTLLLLRSGSGGVPKRVRPYLCFLGFLGSSLAYSSARLEGLRLVMKVAYPVLIFFATLKFIKTRPEADSAVRYWVAGGIVATIFGGMVYLLRGPKAFILGDDVRYSSGLLHPTPFSMYMFALFALCYATWRAGRKRGYAALALLFGLQALMAQSRITWAAIVVGLLFFEASAAASLRNVLRAAALTAGVGIALVYMVWHSAKLQQRFFASEFDPRRSSVEIAQDVNVTGRNLVWAAVYEDYRSHNVWVGQGAGSSGAFLARYLPDQAVPHNEYLRVLHDTGLVGMLLFFVGILGLFLLFGSLLTRRSTQEERFFVRLGLAVLMGYVIEAITDNPMDYYLIFSQYVFFVMGLAMLTARKEGAGGASSRVAPPAAPQRTPKNAQPTRRHPLKAVTA